jgi:hypothetical protein
VTEVEDGLLALVQAFSLGKLFLLLGGFLLDLGC